jgi:hypothetical protein
MYVRDLYLHGHPKDREGLSLSEYMHGHGVNIRHIGLLRSLYLREVAQAFQPTPDPAPFNPALPTLITAPLDPAFQPTPDPFQRIFNSAPLDFIPDRQPTNLAFPTLDPVHFHALQSELFREALCRTLKQILREMQR